jgi:hypothetical protein
MSFAYTIIHNGMNNDYCLRYAHIITYIHTFIMVKFETGTNFPAVRRNSLLAVAMMNIRHR